MLTEYPGTATPDTYLLRPTSPGHRAGEPTRLVHSPRCRPPPLQACRTMGGPRPKAEDFSKKVP
jgi:hypothetical protein